MMMMMTTSRERVIGESIFLLLGLLTAREKGGGHESLQCYYLLHAHVLVLPFSQSHCYTPTLLNGWYVRYVKGMTRGPL